MSFSINSIKNEPPEFLNQLSKFTETEKVFVFDSNNLKSESPENRTESGRLNFLENLVRNHQKKIGSHEAKIVDTNSVSFTSYDDLEKKIIELEKRSQIVDEQINVVDERITNVITEHLEIEEAAFDLEKSQEATSEKIKKFSKELREEKNIAMKIAVVIVFLAGTIFFLIAKALTKV